MEDLKIGAQNWVIDFVDEDCIEHGDYGNCSFDERVILIRHSLPFDVKREVILHEILHAAWGFAGLDENISEEIEESIINRLSPVLDMILVDNVLYPHPTTKADGNNPNC